MRTDNILRGDRVYLTTCSSDDLSTITDWYQDAGFMRLLDARPAVPRATSDLEQWLTEQHASDTAFVFAVRHVDGDRLIGFAEVDGIVWAHRIGWLTVAVGEREMWGRGYGREALDLILDVAFSELNLHRVQLTVFEYNRRAIRLYERAGFRREGTFREFMQRDGVRHDMHLYGMLRPEWLRRQTET